MKESYREGVANRPGPEPCECSRKTAPEALPSSRTGARLGEFRHTITHHHYTLTVLAGAAPAGPARPPFRWFAPAALAQIPLSTTARKALKLAGVP